MFTVIACVLTAAAGWVARSVHAKVPIIPKFTTNSGGGPGDGDEGPK